MIEPGGGSFIHHLPDRGLKPTATIKRRSATATNSTTIDAKFVAKQIGCFRAAAREDVREEEEIPHRKAAKGAKEEEEEIFEFWMEEEEDLNRR